MKISGSIVELKARISASGDTVQTLRMEVHGDFQSLHDLLRKPLTIVIEEEEEGPFHD